MAQVAPVVYVAAEGAAGYAGRKLAWCKHHGKGAGQLWFVGEAVNLLDPAEVLTFTAAIRPLAPALVIFDTLARCMIGGDENSARDMGLMVAACDDLRAATGRNRACGASYRQDGPGGAGQLRATGGL